MGHAYASRFLVCMVALYALTATAQETTGRLSGIVLDSDGKALPGVRVELSGPLLSGSRSSVTPVDGRFAFTHLPPGDEYRVRASVDGFASVEQTSIRVHLGQDQSLRLETRPAVEETIVVEAAQAVIDLSRTTTGLSITSQHYDSMPTRRSFQCLAEMTPGVSLDVARQRPGTRNPIETSPGIGGASPLENNYVIEGMSTADPFNGVSGTNVTMNFVEEVQVITGGFPPEFGRATGGILNVITKSGTNEWRGELFGYVQDAGWSERDTRRQLRGSSTQADGVDSSDAGFSLGGPVLRDRIWFFLAADPTRQRTLTNEFIDRTGDYVNEHHSWKRSVDGYAGKLSLKLSPQAGVVASAFGSPVVEEGWLGAARVEPTVALRRESGSNHNAVLRFHTWTDSRLSIEGHAGRHEQAAWVDPLTPHGQTVPRQTNSLTGVIHGGFGWDSNSLIFRNSAALKAGMNGKGHSAAAGIQVERNRFNDDYRGHDFTYRGSRNPAFNNPALGRRDVLIEDQRRAVGHGITDNIAAFLQDQWQVSSNLQIHAGVRYEMQQLTSGNGAFVIAHPGAEVMRRDSVKFDDNWAPRLGLVWDPSGRGHTKVQLFGGRYFESLPLFLNLFVMSGTGTVRNRYHSSVEHTAANWFNPTGSPLNEDWVLYDTFITAQSDAGLASPFADSAKMQYQDEWSIGLEQRFGPVWSGGIRLVLRTIGRVLEDVGQLSDSSDPESSLSFVIANPGEGAFGAAFSKPRREYRALELVVQRRKTKWQLVSSFVYSRARGDYDGLYFNAYNSIAPNWSPHYDLPEFQRNARGKLAVDRPYEIKAHASYTFDFGLTVGEAFLYAAGTPISAMGPEIQSEYGNGMIFLQPRGSQGRTPDHWTLDLHADYRLPFLRKGERSASLIFDIFNATSNHQVLGVDENYVYMGMPGWDEWQAEENLDDFGNPEFRADLPASPYYKTPTVYQSPRSLQIGLRIHY